MGGGGGGGIQVPDIKSCPHWLIWNSSPMGPWAHIRDLNLPFLPDVKIAMPPLVLFIISMDLAYTRQPDFILAHFLLLGVLLGK
jgi:hypothetical protein